MSVLTHAQRARSIRFWLGELCFDQARQEPRELQRGEVLLREVRPALPALRRRSALPGTILSSHSISGRRAAIALLKLARSLHARLSLGDLIYAYPNARACVALRVCIFFIFYFGGLISARADPRRTGARRTRTRGSSWTTPSAMAAATPGRAKTPTAREDGFRNQHLNKSKRKRTPIAAGTLYCSMF